MAEELRALMLLCAQAVRERRNDPPRRRQIDAVLRDVEPRLALIMMLLARKVAASRGARADLINPGYIIRNIGSLELHVPYHLFDALPEADALLADVMALGNAVRASPTSALCLSGSSLMYGHVAALSDIDFCEYVDTTPQETLQTFANRAARLHEQGVVCLSATLMSSRGRVDLRAPWSTALKKKRTLADTEAAKFEFVATTASEGVIEATNLALFLTSEPDVVERRSHPAQESPLQPGWIPRDLANPREIGEYINFLLRETQEYLQDDVEHLNKAGKRSYALARLLFCADEAESILRELTANDVFLRTAISARLRVRGRIEMAAADRELTGSLSSRSLLTIRDLCARGVTEPVRDLSTALDPGGLATTAWLERVATTVRGPVRGKPRQTISRFAESIASAINI